MTDKTPTDFAKWCELKSKIHEKRTHQYFATREVWWCNLGVNIGYEQDGKGENAMRPVLILQKQSAKLFVGLPLSSRLKPENPNYHPITLFEKEQSVILNQIRVLDSKRLTKKMGRLPEKQFEPIVQKVIGSSEEEPQSTYV